MFENVKLSHSNVRWLLKTLSTAKAQNIKRNPLIDVPDLLESWMFNYLKVVKRIMKHNFSNNVIVNMCAEMTAH